jgi:hypothetical protein
MFLLDEGGDRADRLEEIYWVTEWPQRSGELLNGPIDGRIQCASANCRKIFEIRKGKQVDRAQA